MSNLGPGTYEMMTERNFDVGEYKTRGGSIATITTVCDDGLAGSVAKTDGTAVGTWHANGKYKSWTNPCALDLLAPDDDVIDRLHRRLEDLGKPDPLITEAIAEITMLRDSEDK